MRQLDLVVVLACLAIDLCSAYYYQPNEQPNHPQQQGLSDDQALVDILYQQSAYPERFANVKPKNHHGWGHHGKNEGSLARRSY